ncbi:MULTISPECIES: PAS domain-containing hybrid sensor histidine kinase/response regulator [Rhodonellum]|nr:MULTISPECIES: PAS domain S-box protein [Rhodonellum]SDY88891.1 PAS domain S-box-containing protein [Rhodonellum ikkaensis]
MFKKIIFESSEMVFLADDTFPYNIFYTNSVFEQQVGQFLEDKSLVGLGLDINSYIFKEELIIDFHGRAYSFHLELPQDNGSNYFLFYKGKEVKGKHLPDYKDSEVFFKNSIDLIGIGQENFLTWVSDSIYELLGYSPEELINVDLCQFFHPDDLGMVKEILIGAKKEKEKNRFSARFCAKSGNFFWIDWQIHFMEGKFYAIGRDITESQNKKIERERQNELLRHGVEIYGLGVWEWDPKEHAFYGNDLLYSILEIEEAKVSGIEQYIGFFLPSFQPVMQKSLDDMFTEAKEFDLELKIKTEKGNEKWVRVTGKPRFKDNQVSTALGTFCDISERKSHLDEIGLFKELYNLSPDGILVMDIAGEIIFANREILRKSGLADPKTKKSDIRDLAIGFLDGEVWEDYLLDLKESNSRIFQSELGHVDGSKCTVEVNCNLIQIQAVSYIISFFRDISERVSLEKTLRQSSDFLLHLADQVPGALYQFVLDNEGKMNFSYLSPGIMTLLDLTEEEFSKIGDISMVISKIHPEDISQVLSTSVISARKICPWSCQFRVKKSGIGDFKWVMGGARPELLPNGDVVWYGYLTDISEQKDFEADLKKARESADEANRVKSEFLSMISHDLRTPLNAISGSVYSLAQEEHSFAQGEIINTISFAADNLIIMINDLLDFQKIEAGKLSLENKSINLSEVARQVIKGLEFHAKESFNKLNLYLDPDLDLMVMGDKVRIAQVLNNLITNALKFTKNGQVEVFMKLKSDLSDRINVYFEVKDNGVGIAKEYQDRIFEDFDQIQYSFNKKYGGTGLGLSITKKLLDRMGSKINLESVPGFGSSFFFDLELEKAKVLPQQPKEISIESTNKPKILVAEDNDVNALVLGKIIKKWGFEFDRVSNGEAAVAMVRNGKYDCVLMDIQMPIMDGIEATALIKNISSVPVIALTAASKAEILEKIQKSQFDSFVSKPIDAEELLKKIKDLVLDLNYIS